MKQKCLLILSAAIIALSLMGCGGNMRAVERCAEQYLQTFKAKGIQQAAQYCHFEASESLSQDAYRNMLASSSCAIQDYRILNIEKVNDGLYALKLELLDADGYWKVVYNFVGYIGGSYRYINGIRHIPRALRTDFAPEDYRTTDIRGIAR